MIIYDLLSAAGQVFIGADGYHRCEGGLPMALTIPPTPPTGKRIIAGVTTAIGILLLLAVIAFIFWRKRRQTWNKSVGVTRNRPVGVALADIGYLRASTGSDSI